MAAAQWKDRLVLLLVGSLLTLTMLHVVTSEPAVVGGRRLGAYDVGCLPGGGSTEGTVCSLALGMPRDSRGEPWIAVHPDDPDIIVVAAHALSNATDADAARDPEPQAWTDDRDPVERAQDDLAGNQPTPPEALPRGAPCYYGICIHVTEDGGKSWTARSLPYVQERILSADPVVHFAPDGTLHAFGHKADGGEIAHVQSDDLGRTWAKKELLTAKGFDRPWGAIDPDGDMLLVWQQMEYPFRSRFTHSDDAGATFRPLDVAVGCLTHGPPVHVSGDTWWYACTSRPSPDVGVYAVDAANETVKVVQTFHGWWRPAWTLDAGDALAILHSTASSRTMGRLLLQTTQDMGTTWETPKDILAVARVDNDWSWHWVSWATTDAHGIVHILLVGGDTTSRCYNQSDCPDPGNDREVAWLAVDPATGDLLGEALLTDGPRARPADARPYVGDDFHHMVPYGDGVLLAWGHDAVVELAWVRPTQK